MQRTTNRSLNQYSKLESIYCPNPSALFAITLQSWAVGPIVVAKYVVLEDDSI